MKSVYTRTRVVIVFVAIIVYYILGITLLPQLLAPVGCSGELGIETGASIPSSEFTIFYNSTSEIIIVRHSGGDVLYANTTDQILIEIKRTSETQQFNWIDVGGTYPIKKGNQVSIPNISNFNSTDRDGVVLVKWTGQIQNQADYPLYCPEHGTSESTITGIVGYSEI